MDFCKYLGFHRNANDSGVVDVIGEYSLHRCMPFAKARAYVQGA